jgi:hypothetical protein
MDTVRSLSGLVKANVRSKPWERLCTSCLAVW